MIRIALLAFLALGATHGAASADSDPLVEVRKAIADCLKRTSSDGELERMSACIGVVADKCADAAGATTESIVACNMREQKIWDEWLNSWYLEAEGRLKDNQAAASALKEAQRAWIAFRDAKCGYWTKRYAGGSFASVAAGDCMRVTTGQRALELRGIADDLDH